MTESEGHIEVRDLIEQRQGCGEHNYTPEGKRGEGVGEWEGDNE